MLRIEKFIVGELQTNCYLVTEDRTGESILVDPGARDRNLDRKVRQISNKLEYILLTHGHFDHIAAAKYYSNISKAPIVISKQDSKFIEDSALNMQGDFDIDVEPFIPDILLDDDIDVLRFANKDIEILHSPGHTAGSLCFVLNDMLFTGDTLMKDSMGRTDLPTGGKRAILKSLKMLHDLSGEYKIYPGHGENTGLSAERVNNRYMLYANEHL